MIITEAITATQIIGGNPQKARPETDFYPTPQEVTFALLDFLDIPKREIIWEPACGEYDMANAIKAAGYSVCASDILQGYDFLTEPKKACDWIITNPPFSLSDKFIKRCVEHGKPFALLLKSQYWHAKKRRDLFMENPPRYVLPLTWRPDFLFKQTGKRHAPLMDVMWCVWEPQYRGLPIYLPLLRGGVIKS